MYFYFIKYFEKVMVRKSYKAMYFEAVERSMHFHPKGLVACRAENWSNMRDRLQMVTLALKQISYFTVKERKRKRDGSGADEFIGVVYGVGYGSQQTLEDYYK